MKILLILLMLLIGIESSHAMTASSVGKYDVVMYDFKQGNYSPSIYNGNITLGSDGVWYISCKVTLGSVTSEYPCFNNSWVITNNDLLKINTGTNAFICDGSSNYLLCYRENESQMLSGIKINNYLLVVSKIGNGSGTIISNPSGISCGDTCSATVALSQTYKLLASPDTGSLFGGWSGCDSVSANACTVITTSSKTITATFSKQTYYLAITLSGSVNGYVESDIVGVSCGTNSWGLSNSCTGTYNYGETITLTATPLTGKTFNGWGWSQCTTSTSTTCTFTIIGNKTISIGFQ